MPASGPWVLAAAFLATTPLGCALSTPQTPGVGANAFHRAPLVAEVTAEKALDEGRSGPTQVQVPSQDAISDGDESSAVADLGTILLDDAAYLVTAPARIDAKSALILGGVAAGIGGLMLVDEDIQDFAQRNRTEGLDSAAEVLEDLGSVGAVFAGQVALLGTGWWFRESEAGEKLMETALVGLEAQLFTEAFAGAAKFVFGRSRPSENRGSDFYEPFQSFDRSLPSSHAARAFAVAAVFADRYDHPVPLILYSTATAIGLSRIVLNEHFASDVLAGAALGFAIGKALSWRHQHEDQPLSFLPYVEGRGRGGLGLTVRYAF